MNFCFFTLHITPLWAISVLHFINRNHTYKMSFAKLRVLINVLVNPMHYAVTPKLYNDHTHVPAHTHTHTHTHTQTHTHSHPTFTAHTHTHTHTHMWTDVHIDIQLVFLPTVSVSYTHLTLPTRSTV